MARAKKPPKQIKVKVPARKKAFVCNIIIAVLSILSIAAYFVLPFWKVEVSLHLNKAAVEALMPSEGAPMSLENGEPEFGGESSSGPSEDDIMNNIGNYIGDTDVEIKLAIELKTAYILQAGSGDATAAVQAIVDENVTKMVDTLYPAVNQIIKSVATETTKTLIKDTYKEMIKEAIGSEEESEVNEVLEQAGISDTYVDEKVDNLIDSIYAEDATIDSVSNSIVDTVVEVVNKLGDTGLEEFEGAELTDEDKEEIKASIEEFLVTFADEEGNINMEDALADILLQLLENPEGGIPMVYLTSNDGTPIVLTSSEPAPSTGNSVDDLKIQLTNMISSLIPEETIEVIGQVMSYVSYVIYFSIFTWAYLLLKLLVKCKMKNPCIKVKLPIWLGWLPYLILSIIPNAAINLILNPEPLASIDPSIVTSLAQVGDLLNAMQFNFNSFSCAIVSFYSAMFLILFTIFYYGRVRKRLKKIKKGKIVEIIEGQIPAEDEDLELDTAQEA